MVTISVIGCGNMGSALVKGLSRAGYEEVLVCDPDTSALDAVEEYCWQTTTDPQEAADSEIIFLAVKPDIVADALEPLDLSPSQTLVSMAAGVKREFVADRTDASVVRIMPNLAAETQDMAAAVAWEEPDETVGAILDDLGTYVEVEESLMDVSTALNGSGPAFVFYLLKAMKEGAVEEGLDPSDAEALAAQTFIGAVETVRNADRDIEELIEAVCSPNGTTIEGMRVLRDSTVDEDVGDALAAATERSKELAQEIDDE